MEFKLRVSKVYSETGKIKFFNLWNLYHLMAVFIKSIFLNNEAFIFIFYIACAILGIFVDKFFFGIQLLAVINVS